MIIPYNQAIITNFDRFGGKIVVDSIVNAFISRNSKGGEIYVNPTKQDKQTGYFPRITLSKCAFSVTNSLINFKIECSLPKILFDNNVYELCENDFELLIQALQNKLHRLGLFIEIDVLRNAYVARIDYSKNVIIPHNCWTFINWINKADLDTRLGDTDKDYRNGGSSFKRYTQEYHILIYDKNAEVEKSFYCENRSVSRDNGCQRTLHLRLQNKHIFRFEIAFFKKRKLRKLCESLNLDIGGGRLCDLFKNNIAKTILQHYSNMIFSSIRRLNLDSVNEITLLERIDRAFPNATTNRKQILFTQITLDTKYGADFLRNIFCYTSTQMSSIRKDLKAVNSTQNSPFSSIMQNIHAVEDCLEEFSPLEESDFLTCENG